MKSPEYSSSPSPEKLGSSTETTKKLGQLSRTAALLDGEENFSPKSPESSTQFLESSKVFRDFIHESAYEYRHNHRLYNLSQDQETKFDSQYAKRFMEWYDILQDENIMTIDGKAENADKLKLALTSSFMEAGSSEDKIKESILFFTNSNDMPNFARQMAIFKIQHPIKYIDRYHFQSSGIVSGVLGDAIYDNKKINDVNGKEYGAEEIIYRDLLKCGFLSGGKSIERFLDKLVDGEATMHRILSTTHDDNEPINRLSLPKHKTDNLHSILRQLHAMHYYTLAGEKETYDGSLHNSYSDYGNQRTIAQAKAEIQTVLDEYQTTIRYGLADRVVRSFCHPLGIKNTAEAYAYLHNHRELSNLYHKNNIKRGEIGKIKAGDLIKSIRSADYLSYTLENGVLANEYLGICARSDVTPLDADVSVIEKEYPNFRETINHTSAAYFSSMGGEYGKPNPDGESVFLVFRNNGRFSQNHKTIDWNKYELFPTEESVPKNPNAGLYDDDLYYDDCYGIRTGIPSSEIDYIVSDQNSAEKVIQYVKDSGLYIPVTDLDGNVLF